MTAVCLTSVYRLKSDMLFVEYELLGEQRGSLRVVLFIFLVYSMTHFAFSDEVSLF